jgi:uncharacterized membrane protein
LAQTADIELDPIEIIATLSENGTTRLEISAQVHNIGASVITETSFRVDSLSVGILLATVSSQSVTAIANPLDRYTEILIPIPGGLDTNSSVWMNLELSVTDFQSDSVTSSDGTYLLSDFIFYIRPLSTFKNFIFSATLPVSAILSQDTAVPIFPVASTNYTDGSSLVFEWNVGSLQSGQEQVFIIKYGLPLLQTSSIVPVYSEALLLLLGIALGALLVIIGPRIFQRIRQIGAVRFVGVTNEEEEILETIRQKGGSCSQKDLYTELDLSQSKISIVLTGLEERGLVRRFREGRENVIHIVENDD